MIRRLWHRFVAWYVGGADVTDGGRAATPIRRTCPRCGEPAQPCPGTMKSAGIRSCPFGGWLHDDRRVRPVDAEHPWEDAHDCRPSPAT